jgi:hypothetical protein
MPRTSTPSRIGVTLPIFNVNIGQVSGRGYGLRGICLTTKCHSHCILTYHWHVGLHRANVLDITSMEIVSKRIHSTYSILTDCHRTRSWFIIIPLACTSLASVSWISQRVESVLMAWLVCRRMGNVHHHYAPPVVPRPRSRVHPVHHMACWQCHIRLRYRTCSAMAVSQR